MKKRIVSIELLRILAMMMVVMLHYLGKGNLLQDLTGDISLNGYIAWILETFSAVAVNVYMLISGYFLVESGFKMSRLVELICQVLFYTILVPVVLGCLGIINLESFTIYNILLNVLPIQMNQYWFVTAYVVMYLFSPVLSAAAKSMKKDQLKYTIIGLLLLFSASKTVLPVELAIDNRGYDGLWFLCIFLVASYIRLYGNPISDEGETEGFRQKGVLCYLLSCLGIFLLTFLVRTIYLKTGSLDHFIERGFDYNHILNLLGAIGLFYSFLYWKLPQEGMFATIVLKAAPYSFGVYLVHEQLQMRYLWPQWLGATLAGNPVIFVIRCVLSVLLIYILGTLADIVRATVFRIVKKGAKGIWSNKNV